MLIKVKNLTKKFGPFTAVENISFNLAKGEVLGFLGPNGAGKTTTMRMITGFLPPTSGQIMISKHNKNVAETDRIRLAGFIRRPTTDELQELLKKEYINLEGNELHEFN